MGSRANYIVTENGRHEVFYTHWGAQTMDRDFFFGPDVALALVRASQPTTELLDEVWAEGGAFIDLDQSRLRLWGGDDIRFESRLRDIWIDLMRVSWTHWDIEWASFGVLDLADHVGLPRATVRSKDKPLPSPFDEPTLPTIDLPLYLQTFVTLRTASEHVMDIAIPLGIVHGLRTGPRLLSLLLQQPSVSVPHERDNWPNELIYIDVLAKTMSVCDGYLIDPDVITVIRNHWPGWTITPHIGGMPEHLRVSGRDPRPLYVPLEEHLRRLGRILLAQDVDTADLLRAAGAMDGVQNVQVNPLFHEAPRLEMPESERSNYFRSVVSRWRYPKGNEQ